MSKKPDKTNTEGFKALWSILHNPPTKSDLELVAQELAGHDARIAGVHNLANVLHWFASVVEADCDQMAYEHEKEALRYGDNPTTKDHWMSHVWYTIDGHRMAKYSAVVEEAHERDDELESLQESIQEEFEGEMTEEEAKDAIDGI